MDADGVRYRGTWPNMSGSEPEWPEGGGKRIYAYLKPFPALPRLLALLVELKCPTLVYTDEIDPRLQRRFQSETVRFSRDRLDLDRVAGECDLAILNGGHGTTTAMLVAGKPVLQLPIYLEQSLTGESVARLGAGHAGSAGHRQPVAAGLCPAKVQAVRG